MSWFPKQRVLVPVDFSPESLRAVDVALTLVNEPAGLTVLHVVRTDLVGDVSLPLREKAPQALRDQFSDPKYADIRLEVAYGDPGSEITGYAEHNDIELIVLPSHGRTGIARLMIGSVAERVTRLAHCPVVVFRE